QNATRQAVLGKSNFQFNPFPDHGDQFLLQFSCPDRRIFHLDAVDEVNAKVQMNGFIAQDVLKLRANASHHIAAVERQHHSKAAVEKYPFHDDVEGDQVL